MKAETSSSSSSSSFLCAWVGRRTSDPEKSVEKCLHTLSPQSENPLLTLRKRVGLIADPFPSFPCNRLEIAAIHIRMPINRRGEFEKLCEKEGNKVIFQDNPKQASAIQSALASRIRLVCLGPLFTSHTRFTLCPHIHGQGPFSGDRLPKPRGKLQCHINFFGG